MESRHELCDSSNSALAYTNVHVIERDVITAFRQNRLHLAFQPIVNSQTGKCVAFEAYSRWKSPKYGLISPAEVIIEIDDPCLTRDFLLSIVDELFSTFSFLRAKGISVPLHLNLRLEDITDDLIERFVTHSISLEISLNQLSLEISELSETYLNSALMARIAKLRSYGVKLALSNYGAKYSNDARLSQLPFSKIKINKSLIEDPNLRLDGERMRAKLARWEREGYEVIIEGIEDFNGWEISSHLGNYQCQGFLIAYPMNRTYITSWQRRWNKVAAVLCKQRLAGREYSSPSIAMNA